MSKKRILILGAGVSGLSAAFYLAKTFSDCEVICLEKEKEVGGWMGSKKLGEFLVEKGPRVFKTSRNKELLELASDIGFLDRIKVSPQGVKNRYLWMNGALQKMPRSPLSLLFSPGFRPFLKALWKERSIKPCLEDETIWDFAVRRFGQRAAEELFDPLVLGIYAGDLKTLSMDACFPILKKWEREKGSVIKGALSTAFARKKEKKSSAAFPSSSLFTFEGGSQDFLQKWVSFLSGSVHCNEEVLSLSFEKDKWMAKTKDKIWEAEGLIMALPSCVSSKLLKEVAPKTSHLLSSFSFQDVTCLHMGWKHKVLPLAAFGYLVPRKEKEPILGTLFDSNIQVSEDHRTQITVMIQGVGHTEEELRQIANRVSKIHLGIEEPFDLIYWHKMRGAIAQYQIGHLQKVATLDLLCGQELKNATLVGSYLKGVSVNDCIKEAKEKALRFF